MQLQTRNDDVLIYWVRRTFEIYEENVCRMSGLSRHTRMSETELISSFSFIKLPHVLRNVY